MSGSDIVMGFEEEWIDMVILNGVLSYGKWSCNEIQIYIILTAL